MFAVLLSLALAAVPCGDDEVTILSCAVKAKALAVCAGPKAKPSWVQYRFGPKAKAELVFPEEKSGFSAFLLERRDLVSGTSATLRFTRDGTTYEVWNTIGGRDGGAGVNVQKGEKPLATVRCTGDFTENWDVLEAAIAAEQKGSAKGAAPPDPLAGKTLKQVCEDDALLLLKAPWDELRGGGFHKLCCGKGALGPDGGACPFDWPSGDVPGCSDLDRLRNRVFAYYGYPFKDPKWKAEFGGEPWYRARADFQMSWIPSVGQANTAFLKAYTAQGTGCISDAEIAKFNAPEPPALASAASCHAAATRFSLDAFKAAKGHMDGVQQSEILEAVEGFCTDRWAPLVADCLVSGKGDPCLAALTAAQKKALDDRLREIVPE